MSRGKAARFIGLAVVYGALAGAAARAEDKPVSFSSEYTDLKTDCAAAFKEEELGEGQDMPLRCKGQGGYEVAIDYSAMSAHLRVQPAGGEAVADFPAQPLDFYDKQNKKLEWRLADGKPFAVILRVDRYKDEDSGDPETYAEKNRTGQALLVKGLKGYEHIDFEVDAKTQDANAKAREMADQAYARKP